MNDNIDEFGDVPPPPPPEPTSKKRIPGFAEDIDTDKDEKDKKNKPARTQWALAGPDTYIATGTTRPTLISGVYSISESRGEPLFIQKDINVDDLMEFPDSKSDKIFLKEHSYTGNCSGDCSSMKDYVDIV